MRKILIIALLALVGHIAVAQSYEVQYTYDNAGNRIQRTMVEVEIKSGQLKQDPITDSWEERTVTVFPNPTKGNLRIKIEGGDQEDQFTYVVFDNAGKAIKNGRFNKLGEYPIKLQRYASGMYYLVLECKGDKKTFKIIKE